MYEGEFYMDKANGNGKLTYTNGAIYEGQFVNDMREGKGVFTDPKQNKYSGPYLQGRRHGSGTIQFQGVGTLYIRFDNGKYTNIDDFQFEQNSPWADPDY